MWTRSPPAPSPRRRSFRSESKKEAMRCMASSANEKLPPSARRGLFPFYSSSGKGTMSLRHGAAAVCLRPFPPRQSRVPRQPDRADLFHALAREPRRELCAVRQKILAPSAVKRPLFQRAAAVWTVHLFSSFLFISLFRSLPAIFSSRIPHRIQNSSEIRASLPPRRSA